MTPTESARRSAAALDKLRNADGRALDAALGTLANMQRGQAVIMDTMQATLNDLQRRVDEVKAQHDIEAHQERERMAQRLGRSFEASR